MKYLIIAILLIGCTNDAPIDDNDTDTTVDVDAVPALRGCDAVNDCYDMRVECVEAYQDLTTLCGQVARDIFDCVDEFGCDSQCDCTVFNYELICDDGI